MLFFYIDKDNITIPELLEIYTDIKEKYLDIAEIRLLGLVKAGDLEAIKYWLNNQGKKRGWGVKKKVMIWDAIIFNVEPAFDMSELKNKQKIDSRNRS